MYSKNISIRRTLKLKSPLMRGEDIMYIQSYLVSQGYSIGRFGIDGIYGNATRDAIKSFQMEYCKEVDGIVGKETVKAMGMIWDGC